MPARSRSSTTPSARTATGRTPIPVTSPASRTARSSAPTHEVDAGPNNNWRDPAEMRAELIELFTGSMRGRTMYVVPFSMGPLGSPIAHIGVQLTDSAYVAVSMRIMTRMGQAALDVLGRRRVRPVPPLGRRAARPTAEADVPWPCNADNKYIVHFPETREIWSYGSGYGGNALLGKKCFALRIASVMARDDGWLAEHMLILEAHLARRANEVRRRRVPVGVRQDEPGDARADDAGLEGRDGRRRHLLDEVRRRRPALRDQSRGRVLRRRPRDRRGHQPQRHDDARGNCDLHQHRAHRRRRRVVGGHDRRASPPRLTDWQGNPWTPESDTPAAHPNARFTAPAAQCPSIAPEWEDPAGVPISAILFGGRRAHRRAAGERGFDWQHGVFLGSIMAIETTAAAAGAVGELRFDPFAMLPFCGYNMGDYFAHWLTIGGAADPDKLPRIFWVNWFRKDEDGRFLWPGFGENSRVLKWVFERVTGEAEAVETPIGLLPTLGRHRHERPRRRPTADMAEMLSVDLDGWRARGPADRGALRAVRRAPPDRAARRARRAREAPRRLTAADAGRTLAPAWP